MAKPKLNQIIAVVNGLTSRSDATFAVIRKVMSKKDLFAGFSRTYHPLDEEGEELASEGLRVQQNADQMLHDALTALTARLDAALTRDVGNTIAKAAVVVDGEEIIPPSPVPYLLALDKQIIGQIRGLVEQMPTLDPAEVWSADANVGGYRSEPVDSIRNTTVKEVLVKYPSTDKHPAQTEVYDKQIPKGRWRKVLFSGAVPEERRTVLLERLGLLHDAVRVAVEEANGIEVEQQRTAEAMFSWLLRPVA